MTDIHRTIEAVWKIESTRLIAGIARVTRDIGIAEELAQEAFITALELWPEQGIPENPAAWLMTAAKRRAIDSLRRGRMLLEKHEEIARELEFQQQQLADALDQSLDKVIDDDILRLIFTACHPILAVEGRIALTLRLIGASQRGRSPAPFWYLRRLLDNGSLAPRRLSRKPTFLLRRHVETNCAAGWSPCCRWFT
jgi:predicted RNA polymerase sigma factor